MQGSIKRRGQASWTVIIDLGTHPVTGKRRQLSKAVKGPKRNADAELVQLLHERDTGVERPTGKLTVAAFLEQWLRDYVLGNCAPKTYSTYCQVVRGHLVPTLGSLDLVALRPSHIQALYARMLKDGRRDHHGGGLSARSVLRYHQVLHAALHSAVRWQVLIRNPADSVDPPRAEHRDLSTMTPEQARTVMAAADATPYGSFVRLALLTGMRRGELIGLRWSDVDGSFLHVQQTAQRISGMGVVYRQPKTRLSRRSIALSPDAVAVLRTQRARQAEAKLLAGPAYVDRDLVFATGLGSPIEAGNLARVWYRIRVAAGMPRLRLHDLRHGHATLMLGQGVHPKVVSERLGHASIAITLDTYSHVLPGLQEAAAVALDSILAEPAPKSVSNL